MRTAWVCIGALVIGCGGATATGGAESGESTGGRAQGGVGQSQGTQQGGARVDSDYVIGEIPRTSSRATGASAAPSRGGAAATEPPALGGLGATTNGSRTSVGSAAAPGGMLKTGGASSTAVVTRADGGAPTTKGGASSGGTNTGGSFVGGSPSGGTGNRSFAGGSSLAGAIDPCSLPGAHCTVGNPWPECAQRGGACVAVSSSSGECPDGSYNPFSRDIYCPAAFIGRCCVPNGSVGSPCTGSDSCGAGSACWPEAAHYPPGGVCGHACYASSCPSYGTCITVPWSAAPSVCLVTCTESRYCRTGQSCQAFSQTIGRGEIVYACWSPGSPTGKGLGEVCEHDGECLSYYCRPDAERTRRCSAPCDASKRCLSGYTCVTDPTCSSTQCDSCFPE